MPVYVLVFWYRTRQRFWGVLLRVHSPRIDIEVRVNLN